MSENLIFCDIFTILSSKDVQFTIILSIVASLIGISVFTTKEIIREFIHEWFNHRRQKLKPNIFEIPTSDIPEFHEYLDELELEKNYSNSNILKNTDYDKYCQSYFQWLENENRGKE